MVTNMLVYVLAVDLRASVCCVFVCIFCTLFHLYSYVVIYFHFLCLRTYIHTCCIRNCVNVFVSYLTVNVSPMIARLSHSVSHLFLFFANSFLGQCLFAAAPIVVLVIAITIVTKCKCLFVWLPYGLLK